MRVRFLFLYRKKLLCHHVRHDTRGEAMSPMIPYLQTAFLIPIPAVYTFIILFCSPALSLAEDQYAL